MPSMLLCKKERLVNEFFLGQDAFEDVPLLLHSGSDGSHILRLVEFELSFGTRLEHIPVHVFRIVVKQHAVEFFNVACTTPIFNKRQSTGVVGHQTPNRLRQLMHTGALLAAPDGNTVDQYTRFDQARTLREAYIGRTSRRNVKRQMIRGLLRAQV